MTERADRPMLLKAAELRRRLEAKSPSYEAARIVQAHPGLLPKERADLWQGDRDRDRRMSTAFCPGMT